MTEITPQSFQNYIAFIDAATQNASVTNQLIASLLGYLEKSRTSMQSDNLSLFAGIYGQLSDIQTAATATSTSLSQLQSALAEVEQNIGILPFSGIIDTSDETLRVTPGTFFDTDSGLFVKYAGSGVIPPTGYQLSATHNVTISLGGGREQKVPRTDCLFRFKNSLYRHNGDNLTRLLDESDLDQ